MLLVLFKVFLEGVLDILSLCDFFINDVENVFKNKIHFSNRRLLDEILDDFDLKFAHIDLAETITIISFYSYDS